MTNNPIDIPHGIDTLYNEAVFNYQSSSHDEAWSICKKITVIEPVYPDIPLLCGFIAQGKGELTEAVKWVSRELKINPASIDSFFRLGSIHLSRQSLGDALSCWRTSLIMQPDSALSLNGLGFLLQKSGDLPSAIKLWKRTCISQPSLTAAIANLAKALLKAGSLEDAEYFCRQAIELEPENPETRSDLGNILDRKHLAKEAMHSHRQSLILNPDFAVAMTNYGSVLEKNGYKQEALKTIHRATLLRPDFASAYFNLGVTLQSMHRFEEAEHNYHIALIIEPDLSNLYAKCGDNLQHTEQWDLAVIYYKRSLILDTGFAHAHANFSILLLSMGEMEDGWREYEWRWHAPEMIGSRRNFSEPQWLGEEGNNQILLIHAEQGYGDSLQFCRFAPLAAERKWRIWLEVPAILARLMKSLQNIEQVIYSGDPLPQFAAHCPMASLPLAFNTRLDTVPANIPYLQADIAAAEFWQDRLLADYGDAPRIGLVWSGNPRYQYDQLNAIDKRRSMAPELLQPLFNCRNINFFSLQKDGSPFPEGYPLIDLMPQMQDFADTAALVANLDLVISVDTAVAHLAGALGKPVWLLDRYAPCWRWLKGRNDSPWYPALQIFRQTTSGDWEEVVRKVVSELEKVLTHNKRNFISINHP